MKDCLTLGRELKEQEKAASENAIANVLSMSGNPKINGGVFRRDERECIAHALYESRYDGRDYEDIPTKDEILENFCFRVFGCTFDEVITAWDRFLS